MRRAASAVSKNAIGGRFLVFTLISVMGQFLSKMFSERFVSDSVGSIARRKEIYTKAFLSRKKAGLGGRPLSWKNENEKV